MADRIMYLHILTYVSFTITFEVNRVVQKAMKEY